MMRRLVVIAATGLTLAGCALQQAPTRDEVVERALPESTRVPPAWTSDPAGAAVADDWLASFDDPALNAIVTEALANNLDLRQAADRVEIARQSVVAVGAQLLPQVGGSAGAKRTHDFGDESHVNHTYDHWTASLGLTWELDVWGRLRAQRAAAVAGYEATALDFAFARQSLAATVALSWYLTTETYQLVQLAEQAVSLYADLLRLAQARYSGGKTSELDVVDARAQLETAQSDLQAARDSYGKARRALQVLLGRYPDAQIEAAAAYPRLPSPPGAGVPSALLQRRPDLVAAQRLVLAAFRQEEAARLALLPDFSISLGAQRVDDHLLQQLDLNPWLTKAGIGTVIPIYQGGALRAQVKIATAQQAQAVSNYGKVLLGAFREVEDTLSSQQLLASRLQYAEKALADRTTAVQIATTQYQAGSRALLWVEWLQTEQLVMEQRVIQLRNAQIANRIQLHLALGGSFDATPAVPELAGTDP